MLSKILPHRRRGSAGSAQSGSTMGSVRSAGSGSETEKYFTILNGIEEDIDAANDDVDDLGVIHETLLSTADGTRSEAIARQRDQKTAQINNHIVRLRGELNAVEQMNRNTVQNPSEEATRRSRHAVLARKLMDVLDKYRRLERESQKQYRQRMEKHIRIVMPDATDDEVREAVGNEAARSVFAMDVMSSYRSKVARRMLRDVENRDKDIHEIESTIKLLNNMFVDMQGVVAEQQDILDNIEHAVESTHENMIDASREIKHATWYRIKARKVKLLLI
ncbi:t-SNARE [Coemansia mojavensis]|nr:t-SNARE [Coemansia mojavensis]